MTTTTDTGRDTTVDTDLAALPADEQRHRAREMARAEPGLAAAELAARFGRTDRWGRTQRTAALSGTPERSGASPSRKPDRQRNVPESYRTQTPAPDGSGTFPATQRATTAFRNATGDRSGRTAREQSPVPEHTTARPHSALSDAPESRAVAAGPIPAGLPAGTTTEPPGLVAPDTSARGLVPVPGGTRNVPGNQPGNNANIPGRPAAGTERDRDPEHDPSVPKGTESSATTAERSDPATATAQGEEPDPLGLSGLILLAMAAAMAWSWQHLAHLAVMAGATQGLGPLRMAWLLPISVDVLLVAGAWKARRLQARGRRAGNVTYAALIGSAFMSLGGNVLSTLDMAEISPPIDQWDTRAAIAVVVVVGLWMPSAAILGLEVLRDRGRPARGQHTPRETTP